MSASAETFSQAYPVNFLLLHESRRQSLAALVGCAWGYDAFSNVACENEKISILSFGCVQTRLQLAPAHLLANTVWLRLPSAACSFCCMIVFIIFVGPWQFFFLHEAVPGEVLLCKTVVDAAPDGGKVVCTPRRTASVEAQNSDALFLTLSFH